MAEDPSKSLFTFEYLITERQRDIACDWAVSAAGLGMEKGDRAGRRESSNG
jgi:hypothetical protein